jgi:hypothetical protein
MVQRKFTNFLGAHSLHLSSDTLVSMTTRLHVWVEQLRSYNNQTGSRAHPVTNAGGARGYFLGSKAAVGAKLTIHLHLMLRLRMMELYLHSLAF